MSKGRIIDAGKIEFDESRAAIRIPTLNGVHYLDVRQITTDHIKDIPPEVYNRTEQFEEAIRRACEWGFGDPVILTKLKPGQILDWGIKDESECKRLCDLVLADPANDPDELFRYRWLCRGGGALWCGPTGVGKSTLVMQGIILWAIGKPLFGITPARPLRSLLIQAENDEKELSEMRDEIVKGLQLSKKDCTQATENIRTHAEDSLTGDKFLSQVVAPRLERHKPDLLIIDPALAYLGAEASKQEPVSKFLRNGINPLIRKHGCACIVVHHTNKPRTGEEKPNWAGSDFAYLGSGSIEWANWPRAVMALRNVGSNDVFELRAAKRGQRLGWKDSEGAKMYTKHIAHATEPGVICWYEADPNDVPKAGRPPAASNDDLLSLLPPDGLAVKDWESKAKDENGVSRASFFRIKKALIASGLVTQSCTSGKWQPVNKRT